MLETFLQALCLVLVIEGILPFMYPDRWRTLAAQLASVNNTQLRVMGLVSMLLGAGFLFLLK